MRSFLDRRSGLLSASFAILAALLFAPSFVAAQGGEPQYFAIRGARVVPVSGPPLDDATIVIGRGVIRDIGKDVAIPADAAVIEGKGLTIYPGLFDAFTDVGIVSPPGAAAGEGSARRSATPPAM